MMPIASNFSEGRQTKTNIDTESISDDHNYNREKPQYRDKVTRRIIVLNSVIREGFLF